MSVRFAGIAIALGLGVVGCKGAHGSGGGWGHSSSGHVSSGGGGGGGGGGHSSGGSWGGHSGGGGGGGDHGVAVSAPKPHVAASNGGPSIRGPRVANGIAEPVETLIEAAASSMADMPGEDEAPAPAEAAPVGDRCLSCPDTMPCEACMGDDGRVCLDTPGGASVRCESQTP